MPRATGPFAQDLFFSFTTLTTTGYGNLVPAENPGQSFALAEMLIGQLFLVTAVAKVINSYRPAKRRGLAVEESDSAVLTSPRLPMTRKEGRDADVRRSTGQPCGLPSPDLLASSARRQ